MEHSLSSSQLELIEKPYANFRIPEQPTPGGLGKSVEAKYPNLKERIRALRHLFKVEYTDYIETAKGWQDITKMYLDMIISHLNLQHTDRAPIIIEMEEIDFPNNYYYNLKDTVEIKMLNGTSFTFSVTEFTELGIETLRVARDCFYYIKTVEHEQLVINRQIKEWTAALGLDEQSETSQSETLQTEDAHFIEPFATIFEKFKGRLPEISSVSELCNTTKIKYHGTLCELGFFLNCLQEHGFSVKKLQEMKYKYYYNKTYKTTTYTKAKKESSRGGKRIPEYLKG